jgi:hypothetical protein
MKVVLMLMATLLPACATSPPPPDAGVAVVWNRVEDPHTACESLSGRKNFFNVLGCSHWSRAAGAPRVCSIYAPAPRNERDLQRFATLGHELMHCFDGNWHDRWGRMHSPATVAGAKGTGAAAGGSAARRE